MVLEISSWCLFLIMPNLGRAFFFLKNVFLTRKIIYVRHRKIKKKNLMNEKGPNARITG